MKRFHSKQAAFTLTEILVALFVFSVVVAGALQVFTFLQKATDSNDKQIQRIREVQMAVRQLEEDIRYLVPRTRRDEYGDTSPLIVGESSSVNSYLEFTRAGWRNPAKLSRSELQHLKYEFVDDELLRHHWIYVDPAQGGQELTRVMLTGVTEFKVEFLEDDNWKEDWIIDRGTKGTMPEAVKVTIELNDFGEIYRLFPMADFASNERGESEDENSRGGESGPGNDGGTDIRGRR
ncbi:MAG: type II secretion system minor pseudopilin GspJ [Kangiella sp.]|nr:type II secretion system minor pseudopilin GspJ [Kangiella sp.]